MLMSALKEEEEEEEEEDAVMWTWENILQLFLAVRIFDMRRQQQMSLVPRYVVVNTEKQTVTGCDWLYSGSILKWEWAYICYLRCRRRARP